MLVDARFDELVKVIAVKSRPSSYQSTPLVRGVLADQRCVIECLDDLSFVIYCVVRLIEIRKGKSIEIEVFVLGHMDTSAAHFIYLFFGQLHFFDRVSAPKALRYRGAWSMRAFFVQQLVPAQGILSNVPFIACIHLISALQSWSYDVPGLS